MPDLANKSRKKTNRAFRLIVLTFVLILTTIIGLMHQFSKGFVPVSIDALCPFGAIESAYLLATKGNMLQRVDWSNFILLFSVLLVALLLKRAFCGMICPLGFLQEISHKLCNLFYKKQFTVPTVVDKPLRYLKYIVLAAIIIFTIQLGEMIFRPYDPWVAYHHLFSEDLMAEFSIGLVVLIVTLVASFFYDRFFCKYLCPMGAFLALLAPIGLTGIKRNASTCINCHACSKICPVNIDVNSMTEIKSVECINCNECVNVCPVNATIFIEGKKAFYVPDRRVLETVVIIFALVIGITTYTGDFKLEKQSLAASAQSVGKFNTLLIKGSNTLKEVMELTKLPAKTFTEKYPIKEEEFNQPIKDIGKKYGFETENIRNLVDEHLKRTDTVKK